MPKTKKPKGGNALDKDPVAEAIAKAKDKMSPEDYERYKVLLEDYDRQVDKKMEELENRAIAEAEKAYRETMVEIMKLPTSIRNLNWEDNAHWIMEPEPPTQEPSQHQTGNDKATGGAGTQANKENELKQLRDEIALMKANAIQDVKDQANKTAVKTSKRGRGSRNAANSTVGTSGTKRLTAAAASGTPGGLAGSVDESILTSTINRTVAGNGGRGRRVLQTPGNISMVCPPQTNRKPSNPFGSGKVPATPAAMAKEGGALRVSKPGEQTFTFSENWSPVLNAATATAARGPKGGRGRKVAPPTKATDAKIDIGGERELQLNLDESEGELPQLDPEALAKIKAIRQKLDNLLKHQQE